MKLLRNPSAWLAGAFMILQLSSAAAAESGDFCPVPNEGSFPFLSRAQSLQRDVEFAAGKAEFEAYRQEKKSETSNAIHLPYLLDHGRKTEYSIVLVHGLYESPYYIKGLAKAFHDKGFNVVTVLLPGHWSNPPEKMDQVTYQQWQAEVARGIAMASKLGDQVTVGGYSTGGLLAVDAALSSPDQVKGVFTWAPAMGVSGKTAFKAAFGTTFHLTGNKLSRTPADGVRVPYLSPRAGIEVERLEKNLTQRYGFDGASKNLRAPLFMANSDEDRTIDPKENLEFFSSVKSPKLLVRYRKGDGVNHNRISKAAGDEDFTRPGEHNPYFQAMIQQLDQFIDKQLPQK